MPLYRVDFQGTLYGTENFQHGHHVSSADTASGVATDASAQWLAILGASDFAGNFRTDVIWDQVNVSELGATPGDPIVTSAQALVGDGGTLSTAALPPQCSVVVSIRSATAGSRARGRMFLPPPAAAAMTTAGRLETTAQTEIADAVEDYFDQMTAAAHSLVVVSGVGGVWTTYPALNIRVGNVIDTQRRRRSALAEVYTSRTV